MALINGDSFTIQFPAPCGMPLTDRVVVIRASCSEEPALRAETEIRVGGA
jgi:hypothetical protein